MKILRLCFFLLCLSGCCFAAPVITTDTQATAFNTQGNAAYEAKNYNEAAALFRKAVALAPGEVDYVTNLASAQRQAGEFAEAQKLLQGALESFTDPDAINKLEIALADDHFFWARALVKSDKRAEAIAHYQAAAAIDRIRRPKDAGYDLSNLGSSFHILGRDAESLAAYQESLTRRRALPAADQDKDDEASSLGGIITANLALNSYDAAASAYEELRRLKPEAAPEYEALLLTAQAEAHGPNGQNAGAKAAASALNRLGLAEARAKRYDKAIPSYRRAMELRPTVEAYVLNLARALNGAKRNADAITLIESKLTLFPDPADRKELMIEWADAHYGLGQAQDARSHWAAALLHYFAAYSVDRVARRRDAALDLRHAGEAEWAQRHFVQSEKYQQLSVEIAQEIGDPEVEAISLRELGLALTSREQFVAAIEVLQKALAICRTHKMQTEEARNLGQLATCSNALSRYSEAMAWQRQALAVFNAQGNRSEAASILFNLGTTCDNMSRFAEAQDFNAQALAYWHSVHDTVNETSALCGMGLMFYHQGRYADSIRAYYRALALRGPNGKLQEQPTVLLNLGLTLGEMGRHQDAIRLTRQARAIYQRQKDRTGEVVCLTNLGASFHSLGDYGQAIRFDREALAMRRALGDRAGEAMVLNNAGQLYEEIGQPLRAMGLYKAAVAIRHEIGDRTGEANSLTSMASIALAAGPADSTYYDLAEKQYLQALAIFRETGSANREAVTLGNLGTLNADRNRLPEARKYYELALASHRRSGDRDSESAVLGNLAGLAEAEHHPAEAADYLQQALTLSTSGGSKDNSRVFWTNLMTLASDHGSPSWAIYCGKQSVNILQSMRGSLKSFDKGVQKFYLEIHSPIYRYLANLMIRQGRLDEAQQVLGMLKEEEFFDFLGRDPSAAKTLTATAALTPFEADWEGRFEKATDRAAFLAEMAHAFQTAAPVQASIVRRKTLPAGTAAVYTIVEPDKLQLILTTPTGQVAREYPIAAPDLYRKVLVLRNALQDPTRDPRPLAQNLYKIIVGPIETDLTKAHATTLLWSLDDALRYLPVAALYDGKRYMVERYDNALLTLAAPIQTASSIGVPWTGLGLGVSREHPGFDALPGVRAELSGIFGPVVPGTALLDTQFTQRSFLAGLKHRNHPLVHIASHFSLSGRDTDSFLLLGDGGHLTLADLKADPNVFGGVDLLTLSACNTAMEVRSASGKEVEGFGALAQRLGARSVLASLWPVADASTPTLMREFYRLRRATPKLGKAAGLRQAQIELLRGKITASTLPSKANRANRAKVAGAANTDLPLFTVDPKAPYAHPFYWAPFVLIGNPL